MYSHHDNDKIIMRVIIWWSISLWSFHYHDAIQMQSISRQSVQIQERFCEFYEVAKKSQKSLSQQCDTNTTTITTTTIVNHQLSSDLSLSGCKYLSRQSPFHLHCDFGPARQDTDEWIPLIWWWGWLIMIWWTFVSIHINIKEMVKNAWELFQKLLIFILQTLTLI